MTNRSPQPTLPGGPWRFGAALAVLLALGLYLFTLPDPFVFDDAHDIVEAARVHHLWPADWLVHTRRPFVQLTWALNWTLFGPSPWSFRLVNVVVHALNAALLWACVRAGLRESPALERDADRLATLVATLWAVHPLHTTAVTYVVHRYESVASLFMLATLASWQRASASPHPRRWIALAALAAALAVVSKEISIVGPALLIAYESARCRASTPPRAPRWSGLAAVGAVAWGVAAVVYASSPSSATQGASSGIARADYLRSEFHVLAHYLRLVVAPWPLSVDYSDWPLAVSWRATDVASLLLVAALFACAAWAFFARAPRAAWLGLVAFAVLAPTSTIVPLARELLAERRMYLPLAAITTLVVLGVHRLARGRRAPVGAFALLVGIALAGVTVRRNLDFQTCLTLFGHELRAHPRSGRLHHSMAVCLVQYGRDREALRHYADALRLDPGCCVIHPPMAGLALRLGLDDEALQHINAQIALSPQSHAPWLSAINVLLSMGSDARARRVAERAAARFPQTPEVIEKLAWVLATARDPAVVDGARALREAQRAIELTRERPTPVTRAITLAAALAAAGRFDDAQRLTALALSQARASGRATWVRTLERHLAAYEARQRWIESGIRRGDAALSAWPTEPR